MKKNAPMILSVIACALLVISLFQINGLRREVSYLQSRLNSEMNDMNSAVSNIYGEVQAMLEEEASLLSMSEWEYGGIDEENRTAEVICTIVPKVHTPGTTRANLIYDGQEAPMAYANGQYTAALTLPLFEETRIGQVMLDDNGTIRTQELDWHIAPRYEALPASYAGVAGGAKGKPGEGAYAWAVDYSVHINVEGKKPYRIESVELVEVLDGKETGRLPVDISEAGQKAYADAASRAGHGIPETAGNVAYHGGQAVEAGYVGFLYYLNKEYHIPNGSELAIYVDVVDGNGLRYRSFAEGIAIGADGRIDDARTEEMRMFDFAEPIWIFDEMGNVIYEIESEYFQ